MALSNDLPDGGDPAPATDPALDALLRERDGYLLRGLTQRVAAVDAAIRAAGGTPPKAEVETAVKAVPKGRG